MDPQTLRNLTQVFQQGLAILQQAQQQQGGGMMPPDGGDDSDEPGQGMPDAGMVPPGAPGAGAPEMQEGGGDDGMGGPGDDGMGGNNSLHDRVSELENHTGLKKAAGGNPGSMGDRLDELETEILGQQFDGPMVLRVQQLEKALGTEPNTSLADSAPDEIPLDVLIKTAVRDALADMGGDRGGLPSPQSMRKAAQNGHNHIGTRRAQPPAISGDEDLVKAAQGWGMAGEDLDQPVSFGDILQMQYYANQMGVDSPLGDDDD